MVLHLSSRTAAGLDIVGTCSRTRHRSKGKISRGFTLLDDSRPLLHSSPLQVARSAWRLVQARLLLVFPSRQRLHPRQTLSPYTVHVYIFFFFLLFRCVYIVVLLVAVFLTTGIFQRGVTASVPCSYTVVIRPRRHLGED